MGREEQRVSCFNIKELSDCAVPQYQTGDMPVEILGQYQRGEEPRGC